MPDHMFAKDARANDLKTVGGAVPRNRLAALTGAQRVMLLVQLALIVLFLILYIVLGRQQVIRYRGALLRCQTEEDVTVYSGELDGRKVVFNVSGGTVVEYCLDGAVCGTYTVEEDPGAVPQKGEISGMAELLTGVEIRRDGQPWFRGAYMDTDFSLLFEEDGGISLGIEGAEPFEPRVWDILSIALAPGVVPRANWGFFGLGALCCVICAVGILFADALFRWNLRFTIRDPESAEPSDWELFSRWIVWIALTAFALFLLILGLNAPML